MTHHAPPFEALLFDMDGTLSDTERLWVEAEQTVAAENGGPPASQQTPQEPGSSLEAGSAYLKEHYGLALSIDEIQRLTVDHVLAGIRRGFDWQPGALELLAEAKRLGLPTALVTTSPRAIAEAVASALPDGSLDTIVADEDVARTKPDPAPYLTAAHRLGVDPSRCAAFEDSLTGTRSAQAAGCFVVAVPPGPTIPEAPRRIVLPSLEGLTIERLAELAQG